jgi:hypothetical protein
MGLSHEVQAAHGAGWQMRLGRLRRALFKVPRAAMAAAEALLDHDGEVLCGTMAFHLSCCSDIIPDLAASGETPEAAILFSASLKIFWICITGTFSPFRRFPGHVPHFRGRKSEEMSNDA